MYFGLQEALADYGPIYLIVLGLVAVVVTFRAPRGLWGLITSRGHWQLFPLRRRLVADDAGGKAG